jgi:hypothetical protein
VVIFLDLILLKPQVYRHILFNRLPYKETGIHVCGTVHELYRTLITAIVDSIYQTVFNLAVLLDM